MSTVWKQKPNSSRSATALLGVHRSAMLAGRRELQQTLDWNPLFARVADQNARISRMSAGHSALNALKESKGTIVTSARKSAKRDKAARPAMRRPREASTR